ncbi:MAG: T9SS type A sorting domain-containing protein [Saprospiraceae bacterium]|nr:T9SS type A sorting domain-containing protein [Saprospiraceae bacterium]
MKKIRTPNSFQCNCVKVKTPVTPIGLLYLMCGFFLLHPIIIKSQCPPPGRIELCSQEELILFAQLYPNCETLEGDLIISLEVEDLRPLPRIKEILGDLEIYETDSLFRLDGLDSLQYISGDLRIAINLRLVDLEGLSHLQEIGGGLYFYQHRNYIDSLTQIDGLRNVRKVGRFISIRNNDYLSNLDGLSGLTEIPEDLRIQSNLSLKNIEGLRNLRKIGGHLRLIGLRVLQDLNGLKNLESIGNQVTIMGLSSIKNLKPLSKLKTIGGKLQINLNPELSSLEGIEELDHETISELILRDNIKLNLCHVKSICDWIKHKQFQIYDIDHNLDACDSYALIEEACRSVGTIQFADNLEWSVYPNPAEDQIRIQLANIQNSGFFQILNLQGQEVKQFRIQQGMDHDWIRLDDLPSGVYLCRVLYNDSTSAFLKFIKE